jgi:hypothetical protein
VSYQLDVRKVEEAQYDGSTGAQIESITTYQLGATIDGVFVPFVSKQGGYIDSQVQRGKAAGETSEPADTEQSDDGGDGSASTSGTNG